MYQIGQLGELLAQPESHGEGNLAATEIPSDDADAMETEIHALFSLWVGFAGVPPVMAACALTQAGYLLGLRHGAERAFKAADELAKLNPRQFEEGP